MKYHVIFTPFKGQIYSKQGSHVSLMFGTWTFVLFSHVWWNQRFYCYLWADKLRRRSTFAWKHKLNYVFLTRFSYTLFTKTLLLFRISLLKRFIYWRVNIFKILHGATIPVTLTKNYVKTIFLHFIKKFTFLSFYLLPAHKKNLATRKAYLFNWFRVFHMLVEKILLPVAYVTE